ncbi:MAG: serine protease [Solirubrobacterales bacterium]|nr:serine protease [Solirubrobacterales bacterium]
MSRVAQSTRRAALLGCGLLLALTLFLPRADAAPGPAQGPKAGISIVNGRSTTIREWPWQVGIVVAQRVKPRALTSRRFFCGGSVLAPRLIITAGHCVSDLNLQKVRKLEVVSGRTRLNSNRGQVARVVDYRMARNPNTGHRRFRMVDGAADWDVALLVLDRPLDAEPIKIAGPDEAESWATGQKAWVTGWGVTKAFSKRVPARLQVADQVLMGKGLCRRSDGRSFRATTMTCVGGPGGHASSCNGDSGGPLMVETSDGYRLAGLTSYGDEACTGFIPSVYTRVAGDPIRSWVERTARNLVGADVVGSGGESPTPPRWCRVPSVIGLTTAKARVKLSAQGCRLGKVRRDRWGAGRTGRIDGMSRLPGWLARPGSRIAVWVSA